MLSGATSRPAYREALEKGRRQAKQLRRNARTVFRALEGWQRVGAAEEWAKVWQESREEYESGRFLLERLGAERHLDPKLMATLWEAVLPSDGAERDSIPTFARN
jgi:hypothetical protein